MKKNAMLKIAAILMVAVLLTTCAISSTFAKYVTTGAEAKDTARVAKWGVEIVTDATGLFLGEYDGNGDLSVDASTGDVVAPGTTNTAKITTDVKGSPEVAFEITTEAVVTLSNWQIDANTPYCPLVFTVNETDYTFRDDENASETVAQFAARVQNAIKAQGSKSFGPGEYVASSDTVPADVEIEVTWAWAFSTTGNDANDTALANKTTEVPTVEVKITQTASQLDTYTPSN